MSSLFISYRRETAAGETRALFGDLVARLGKDSVFMDVDSIALGRDFRSVLQKTLESCDVMLVVIDKDWVEAKDEKGKLRLENSNDYVRIEVSAALKRDIVVTPVLVGGARIPAAEQLPADIRDLVYRNAFEITYNRWESDVHEMVRRLGLDAPKESQATIPPDDLGLGQIWRRAKWVLSAVFLLAAVGGIYTFGSLRLETVKENVAGRGVPQDMIGVIVGTVIGGIFLALISTPLAIWFNRYVHILGAGAEPDGSPGRRAYDELRETLSKGGVAARIYASWLQKTLDAVDRLFNDAGGTVRSLFPHAFGLQTVAPTWTAPAFERCVLLSVVYPTVTIFTLWAVWGHVGPAEAAMGLPNYLSMPQRGTTFLAAVLAILCWYRATKCEGWKHFFMWCLFSLIGAVVVALGVGQGRGAIAGSVGLCSSILGLIAGDLAVLISAAAAGALAGGIVFAFAGNVAGSAAAAAGVLVIGIGARLTAHETASWRHPKAVWMLPVLAMITLACIGASRTLSSLNSWPWAGPLLLLIILLPLLNAPFVWFSVGLTRALLRRGLERQKLWPYVYAIVDATLAVLVVLFLAVVMVIGVQTFDLMAVVGGGKAVLPLVGKPDLNLVPLFDGIAMNPGAPEYWWVYTLMLSTMIPSLVNLTIGGLSLTRGFPPLSAWLYNRMPVGEAVAAHNRNIIALIMMFQWLVGLLLGIAAQSALVLLIFGRVLPWLGFDMLDLARWVAGLDLPARFLH